MDERPAGTRGSETRPRDEDFSRQQLPVNPPEKKKIDPRPKPWVILLIVLAGLLFAVLSVFLFYLNSQNSITVIGIGDSTAVMESFTVTEEAEEDATYFIPAKRKDDYIPIDESEKDDRGKATADASDEAAESQPPEDDDASAEYGDPEDHDFEDETTETTEPTPETSEEVEYGGIITHVSRGSTILIKCYSSDNVIELPSFIHGQTITGIAEDCFNGCEHLTHIDLAPGLERIGARAFANCPNLQEVVIPDTVTEIDDSAFEGSYHLIIVGHLGQYSEAYAAGKGIGFIEGDKPSILNGE